MRLINFLNDAVITVNLRWLEEKIKECKKLINSRTHILPVLNSIFADHYIRFEKTARGQSSDDWLASVGINYAAIEQKPPFWVTIYVDDLSTVFRNYDDDKYEVFDAWADAVFRLLKHELLHREQNIRNKSKTLSKGFKSREEYLSNPKEIMALAYETYLLLLAYQLGPEDFEQLDDFSNLEDFLEYFPKGSNERNRFLKYLFAYFNRA